MEGRPNSEEYAFIMNQVSSILRIQYDTFQLLRNYSDLNITSKERYLSKDT